MRQFSPGDQLLYTYEVYNAVEAVEASPTVWRDGRQVFSAPPDSLRGTAESGPLRTVGALHLDAALTPGDYVLQIVARTATHRKKPSVATTRGFSRQVTTDSTNSTDFASVTLMAGPYHL